MLQVYFSPIQTHGVLLGGSLHGYAYGLWVNPNEEIRYDTGAATWAKEDVL